MGLNLSAKQYRRTGNPHRRLDCRPAIGRAFHAGAIRRRQFHPIFHRQPPFRAGLSGRRGSCSASLNMSAASYCKPSILDRLSGPLCDAVTGQEDGRGMLEALERGNLFVIPLDDQRQWYRYHHLFADVLQAHLREAQPDRVSSSASAGERVVRAERSAIRCHPSCAGCQGLRARSRLDRTGMAGSRGGKYPARYMAWLGEERCRKSWSAPGLCSMFGMPMHYWGVVSWKPQSPD